MKTKNKNTTIYVVSSHDYDGDHLTIGAWRTRGHALDAATDYILERLHFRKNIGYAFADDYEHPDMVNAVDYDDDGKLVFVKPKPEVRAYVRDVLGCDGCYFIEKVDGFMHSFRFDIDECDIED